MRPIIIPTTINRPMLGSLSSGGGIISCPEFDLVLAFASIAAMVRRNV